MKKRFISLLTAIVTVISMSSASFASETDFAKPSLDREFLASADIYDSGEGTVIVTRTSTEPQLFNFGAGNVSHEKEETVVLVPDEGATTSDVINELHSFMNSRASGHKYEEQEDTSASFLGYITIYYDRSQVSGSAMDYILITEVSGGVELLDPNGKGEVVSQEVMVACTAQNGTLNQRMTRYPSSLTWSYDTPSSWIPAAFTDGLSVLGAANIITVKRTYSDHTWDFRVESQLTGYGA